MKKGDSDYQSTEELQNLLVQKEAAIQAKGRMIDNMAYQIRTLSNAVIGFSDLLLSERLPNELVEYVKEINQAGNGLSSLVNEVLDWAQVESGRLQVSHTKCDLLSIIKHIERIVSAAAVEKGLNYRIEVDPDLPSYIINDQDRLLKCLINLIANAFKYTQEGSINIRILRHYQDAKPHVRIDIADSGVGISPDKIHHLFEPSFSKEDANHEVLTMLDMGFTVTAGLPLTKQLIELLGGTLQVSSELNVGSTFSVLVPPGFDADGVDKLGPYLAISQEEQEPAENTQPSVSVLLVEDQPSNRTVIGLMLETLGVLVETAEDGLEGVEKASQKEYDLILMDLKMPRMDGYQATGKIREKRPSTPIVALSAKVLNEKENEDIVSLFDGFLTKPVDSHKLSETIKKFAGAAPAASLQTEPLTESAANQDGAEEMITLRFESCSRDTE